MQLAMFVSRHVHTHFYMFSHIHTLYTVPQSNSDNNENISMLRYYVACNACMGASVVHSHFSTPRWQ